MLSWSRCERIENSFFLSSISSWRKKNFKDQLHEIFRQAKMFDFDHSEAACCSSFELFSRHSWLSLARELWSSACDILCWLTATNLKKKSYEVFDSLCVVLFVVVQHRKMPLTGKYAAEIIINKNIYIPLIAFTVAGGAHFNFEFDSFSCARRFWDNLHLPLLVQSIMITLLQRVMIFFFDTFRLFGLFAIHTTVECFWSGERDGECALHTMNDHAESV